MPRFYFMVNLSFSWILLSAELSHGSIYESKNVRDFFERLKSYPVYPHFSK